MLENYLAFAVRPIEGSWEVLILSTWCGAATDQFDTLRGRVPHGRDADEVIRRNAERYGVNLLERMTILGDEPLLKTRRRSVYIYRADDKLPISWTRRIEPEGNKKLAGMPEIIGHFRFVDLREPVPINNAEAVWLDRLRKTVGVTPPVPTALVMFDPVGRSIGASEAKTIATALIAGEVPATVKTADFERLARNIRKNSTLTGPQQMEIRRIGPKGARLGLVVQINRDGQSHAFARTMVIGHGNEMRLWTYDASADRLYRENESPAMPGEEVSSDRVLNEVRFDRELMAELSRQSGALMIWPLPPPVDQNGHRDNYRDPPLPHALWTLPENQRLILDLSFFNYFDSGNIAMICPAAEDVELLREFDSRRIRQTEHVHSVELFERVAGWSEIVERLGWAYLPNGPDTMWGDLHVAGRHQSLLASLKDWCQPNGRTWSRFENRRGELVRIVEPVSAIR